MSDLRILRACAEEAKKAEAAAVLIGALNITCTLLRKGMYCFFGKGCTEFPKKVHYCIGILTHRISCLST